MFSLHNNQVSAIYVHCILFRYQLLNLYNVPNTLSTRNFCSTSTPIYIYMIGSRIIEQGNEFNYLGHPTSHLKQR